MIVEYIRYTLEAHQPQELVDAYEQAQCQLEASPNALARELSQSVDDPKQMILRIEKDSAEGHMKGFRSGEYLGPFLALRPFVGEIAEMRHYDVTSVQSTGREG